MYRINLIIKVDKCLCVLLSDLDGKVDFHRNWSSTIGSSAKSRLYHLPTPCQQQSRKKTEIRFFKGIFCKFVLRNQQTKKKLICQVETLPPPHPPCQPQSHKKIKKKNCPLGWFFLDGSFCIFVWKKSTNKKEAQLPRVDYTTSAPPANNNLVKK